MPNILFRADADSSIGIGDLMSLIYLSNIFYRNSWKCFFVVRDYDLVLKILKKQNLDNIYFIPKTFSLNDEISFIKKICKDKATDCLFMEITKNNLKEYADLKKPAPLKACINFDGIITDDFDVVINWCIDASDDLYTDYYKEDKQFILGFQNTILPDYFYYKQISRRVYSKCIKKILISMGGVDEFNLSARIAKVLSQRMHNSEVRVIAGPGYMDQEDSFQLIRDKFKKFTLKRDVENLFEDYLWADLAFSAGGLTSSELVATRTPSILIATYEHQIKRCEYFSKNRLAYYAGSHLEVDETKILESLDKLIDKIDLFRENLSNSEFKGGNEKIFESINSRR